jgi:hypothetical protein
MLTETEKNVIFPWREAYSVGMPEIDEQHKGCEFSARVRDSIQG